MVFAKSFPSVDSFSNVNVICLFREIASGTITDSGSIKANDRTAVKIPTQVPYDILLTIMRDIGSDWDIDYQIDVGLTIDLPIIGNFTIPLSKKGTFKLPTLADIF